MARKDKHTKIAHAAHIKRHTEGTSNELSFSVLDAAKNAADAGEGLDSKARVPSFGGIPLFTLPGKRKPRTTPQKEESLPLSSRGPVGMGALPSSSASTSSEPLRAVPKAKYEPPVDEIARRKTRRRFRNGLAIAAAAAIVVGLVGTGASFLYKEHVAYNERLSHLEVALADLTSADEVIVEMDAVINADVTDETAEKVSEVKARLPEASMLLDSADAAVQAADSDANPPQEKEAVARARAAIDARRDLIEQGPVLMDAALAANKAGDIVAAVWTDVIGADALAREAATLVADTTVENVEASRAKSVEAKDLFTEALSLLWTAVDDYPDVDLSDQITYVEKRIAAMEYAIASDDAILAYNKEEAAAQNDAYNAVDREAAELAKTLSDNPAELVRSAYLRNTEESSKLYKEARLRAETADSFLNDYLGSNGK